jgi:hypothetical protein
MVVNNYRLLVSIKGTIRLRVHKMNTKNNYKYYKWTESNWSNIINDSMLNLNKIYEFIDF